MRLRLTTGFTLILIWLLFGAVLPANRLAANICFAQSGASDNTGPADHWTMAPESVSKQVTSMIVAQLKAFKKDDYGGAAAYQSAELKQGMGTTSAFKTMMKNRYPEFVDYRTVVFGPIFTSDDRKSVQVPIVLTGTDGVSVAAIYLMVREHGTYRISGVLGGVTSEAPGVCKPAVELASENAVEKLSITLRCGVYFEIQSTFRCLHSTWTELCRIEGCYRG